MNIYTVILIIVFGICRKECFSQGGRRNCDSMLINAKRYEVEQGVLKYFVYSLDGKGKKKHKLFAVHITFKEYGRVQDINFNIEGLFDVQIMDSSFSRDSDKFLLNYFVLDHCSVFYKGMRAIKPIDEKYKGQKCIRYIQYSFDDYYGNNHMGTVKYCKGIPVYIRGGVIAQKALIWELQ